MELDNLDSPNVKQDFQNQVQEILGSYEKERERTLFISVSWGIVGMFFIIFMLSIWAETPGLLKGILLFIGTCGAYHFGAKYHQEKIRLSGFFMSLGLMLFGFTMFQIKHILHMPVFTTTSYVIWGLIALLLALLTKNQYIIVLTTLVTFLGQIHMTADELFSYLIFSFSLISSYLLFKLENNKVVTLTIGITLFAQMVYLGFQLEFNYAFYPIICGVLYTLGELNGWTTKTDSLKKGILGFALIQNILFVLFPSLYSRINHISWKQIFILVLIYSVLLFFIYLLKNYQGKVNSMGDLIVLFPIFLFGKYAFVLGIIIISAYALYLLKKDMFSESEQITNSSAILTLSVLLLTFTKMTWWFINKPLFFLLVAVFILLFSFNIKEIKEKILPSFLLNKVRKKDHKRGEKDYE